MKTSELAKQGFTCLQDQHEDAELTGGYTSDLLSDVMANLQDGQVLITIQAHKNTIAVASLADAAAVVFCHGRKVETDVIEAAAKEGIALFSSPENQFDTTRAIAKSLGL
jgi:phosphoglycerate dehydrogenase-like enzyme